MTSVELNAAISGLDSEPMFESLPHGKPIPYIGWFWRTVDFDESRYTFGVCPVHPGLPPYIGFMENNKWGYGYVYADEAQTSEIRALIETAVKEKSLTAMKAANDAIQALGKNMKTVERTVLVIE